MSKQQLPAKHTTDMRDDVLDHSSAKTVPLLSCLLYNSFPLLSDSCSILG